MRIVVTLAMLVLVGAAVVVLIAWLSNRPSLALRVIGATLSGVVSIYCLFYVVALIAESRVSFRPSVGAMVLVFAATAVGAVYSAFRAFRPRVRAFGSPNP